MERLLNLLQEFYGEDRKFINENGLLTMTNGVENLKGAYAQTYIISLQGGFIKWLVENEKIDYEKVRSGEGNGSRWHFETVQPEYFIIMLLSIQDEPIKFLLEILK